MLGQKTRGILLDLDDTLYEERCYFVSGLHAVANWLGGGSREVCSEWHTRLQNDVLLHGRNGVIDRLPVPDNCDESGWRLALLSVYRNHQPHLRLFPDVSDFILRCRQESCSVAIVTDGKSCVQWRKLQALGLPAVVDAVLCTDDIDRCKPSVDPFRVMCNLLGLPADSCVYLADDASKDFIGPRKLGMASIQVVRALAFPLAQATSIKTIEADFCVGDLIAAEVLIFGDSR